MALIAYCVSRFRTATTTVGSLVGIWLFFTLALPAMVATGSEALHPTPSRLALLSEIRAAQSATNKELAEITAGFLLDHPDLSVGDESMPAYMHAAFLSNRTAREKTQPIVAAFGKAQSARENTLRWVQYLSPALITQRLLLLSSGGDLNRQLRFQAQVQSALAELGESIGPAIVSRNRLTLQEYDRLSEFSFTDVSASQVSRSAVGPVFYIILLSLILSVAASRRLSREEVVVAA